MDMPLVERADVCPGLNISRVVKGCWQLSGGHKGDRTSDRTTGREAESDFGAFVDVGVTTFDTADIYGPSEQIIGRFIKKRGGEGASPPVQVLTKSCWFGNEMRSLDRSAVDRGVDRSRKNLGVDKLDLVQLYWHDYSVANYLDAMRFLSENPNVSHVGVTNMDTQRLKEFVDAGTKPVLNQVQYSLLDRRPENGMVAYCKANDIKLLPYGVLAGGFLSEKYLGAKASSIKVDTYSKSKYASVIQQLGGWDWFQGLLKTLATVAEKHGTSIGNVACKWVLGRDQVVAILVGARNADHVADHQALGSFALDAGDLSAIQAALDAGAKAQGDVYDWERGGTGWAA